jgi:uncharacterized membrane protein
MLFLAILVPSTAIAWLLGRRSATWRDHARRGLAAAMVIAGITHFTNVDPFVQHLPEWVPVRELVVYVTGAIEIILGAALMFARARRAALGRLVAVYLIAVFPANIYVAIADVDVTGQPGGVYAWVRLPLQVLFVLWALASTIDARTQLREALGAGRRGPLMTSTASAPNPAALADHPAVTPGH